MKATKAPKRPAVPRIEWPAAPRIIKSRQLVGDQPVTIRRRWQSKCGRFAVEHVVYWHPDMPILWLTYRWDYTTAGGGYWVKHSEHRSRKAAMAAIAAYHKEQYA